MIGKIASFLQGRREQIPEYESINDYLASYLSPLSPEKQVRAARRILGKIPTGQKKLIEPFVDPSDNILKYRSAYDDPDPAIGRKVFDTVDDAIQYFSSLQITEVYRISKQDVPVVYRGYAEVLKDIERNAIAQNLFGIEGLEMNIAIHKGQMDSQQGNEALKAFFKTQKEKGYGLLLPTDEGGVAMNLVATIAGKRQVLNLEQTLEVMQSANVSIIDPDVLEEAMRSGNKKLASLIQKLDKRLRGVLSPREISIAGDAMRRVLDEVGKPGMSFADSILNTDPVYEALGLALDVDTLKNVSTMKNAEKAADAAQRIRDSWMIKGTDRSKEFYKIILDEVIQGQSGPSKKLAGKESQIYADVTSYLKIAMQDAIDSGDVDITVGKYGTDVLKKKLGSLKETLEKKAGGSEAALEAIDQKFSIIDILLDEIEKGSDGSMLINTPYTKAIQRGYQAELDELDKLYSQAKNRLEKEDILLKKREIQKAMSQLDESKGLSQITVRGNVVFDEGDATRPARIFSLKGAAMDVEFTGRYTKYSIVAPKATTKRETRISGVRDILNISGTGESKGAVYADPMLDAFHSAVFGSTQSQKLGREYSQQVQKELNAMLKANRIDESSTFFQSLQRAANEMSSDLLETQQYSQLMHRTLAQEILAIHKSGVPLDQHPRAMNRILDFAQKEFFKLKKGIPLPVMPDVYRFALNAESTQVGISGGRMFLDMADSNIAMDEGFSINTTRVRFSNHNLLMTERDVIRFHHALGGFDLDDKGLPVLGTYMSNGKRRLAMAMARQPTGAGEMVGFVEFRDVESYRELFGHNKDFLKTLDQMILDEEEKLAYLQGSGGSPALQRLNILKENLTGKLTAEDMTRIDESGILDQLEETIIDVRDRLYGGKARTFNRSYFEALGVLKQGESTVNFFAGSRLVDFAGVDPGLASLGFQKLKTEVMTLNLENDVFTALEHLMTDQQKTQLGAIRNQIEQLKEPAYAGRAIPGSLYDDPSQVAALEEAQTNLSKASKDFYKTLDGFGLDKDKRAIAMNKYYLEAMEKAATENGNNLGRHVNRATVIADGLNQFEKAFGSNQAINDALRSKGYVIGLPASETAVDMTQTFTSGRLTLKAEAETAADLRYGMDIFKRMYGNNFDLEEHGADSVSRYGKMFGYLQNREGKTFTLDKALLEFGKLNTEDLRSFAESYIAGAEERIAEGIGIEEDLSTIKALFNKGDAPGKRQLIDALTQTGIIGRGNLSETISVAKEAFDYLNATRKRFSDNLNELRDTLTAGMGKNATEARESARVILDANKEIFKELNDSTKKYREAQEILNSGIEKGNFISAARREELSIGFEGARLRAEGLKTELGDNLLSGINEVRSQRPLTGFNLLNALQLEALDRGMSPYVFEGLQDLTENSNEEFANFFARVNRAKRQKAAYMKATSNLQVQSMVDNFFATTSSMRDLLLGDIVGGTLLDLSQYGDVTNVFSASGINIDATQLRAALNEGVMDTTDQNIATIANAIRSRALYETQILDPAVDDFLNGQISADKVVGPKDGPTGIVRDVLRELGDQSPSNVNPSKFKRLDMDYLTEQFSKPSVQKAAIGAGLLIAGSFLYQNKKDRTAEDAAGPPLLPGGSAYEEGYPSPNVSMPQVAGGGYSSGMSYKVSLYGSREEVERFQQAASGVTNGSVNSTMYNRIPSVTSDPYQQLASSF